MLWRTVQRQLKVQGLPAPDRAALLLPVAGVDDNRERSYFSSWAQVWEPVGSGLRGAGIEVGLATKVLAWEVGSVGVPSGVLQTAS